MINLRLPPWFRATMIIGCFFLACGNLKALLTEQLTWFLGAFNRLHWYFLHCMCVFLWCNHEPWVILPLASDGHFQFQSWQFMWQFVVLLFTYWGYPGTNVKYDVRRVFVSTGRLSLTMTINDVKHSAWPSHTAILFKADACPYVKSQPQKLFQKYCAEVCFPF